MQPPAGALWFGADQGAKSKVEFIVCLPSEYYCQSQPAHPYFSPYCSYTGSMESSSNYVRKNSILLSEG